MVGGVVGYQVMLLLLPPGLVRLPQQSGLEAGQDRELCFGEIGPSLRSPKSGPLWPPFPLPSEWLSSRPSLQTNLLSLLIRLGSCSVLALRSCTSCL